MSIGAAKRPLTPLGRRVLTVRRNEPLGAYRLLWVDDSDGPAPAPGQFAMIAAAEHWGGRQDERPYLARAFSIARRLGAEAGEREGESAFMLEDVGPGTGRLCELAPSEGLTVLGPLGRGFSPAPKGQQVALVGGGVGIAPLAILQDALIASGQESVALLGFRDAAHAEAARLLSDPRVATDDGSVGHSGLVTDLLEEELTGDRSLAVRACGPPPMLEAVRAICEREGVDAELALEAPMACGFGSCHGCVVPRRDGSYLRVCLDGPVVDAAELERVA